jgi:hypothetical protein
MDLAALDVFVAVVKSGVAEDVFVFVGIIRRHVTVGWRCGAFGSGGGNVVAIAGGKSSFAVGAIAIVSTGFLIAWAFARRRYSVDFPIAISIAVAVSISFAITIAIPSDRDPVAMNRPGIAVSTIAGESLTHRQARFSRCFAHRFMRLLALARSNESDRLAIGGGLFAARRGLDCRGQGVRRGRQALRRTGRRLFVRCGLT